MHSQAPGCPGGALVQSSARCGLGQLCTSYAQPSWTRGQEAAILRGLPVGGVILEGMGLTEMSSTSFHILQTSEDAEDTQHLVSTCSVLGLFTRISSPNSHTDPARWAPLLRFYR